MAHKRHKCCHEMRTHACQNAFAAGGRSRDPAIELTALRQTYSWIFYWWEDGRREEKGWCDLGDDCFLTLRADGRPVSWDRTWWVENQTQRGRTPAFDRRVRDAKAVDDIIRRLGPNVWSGEIKRRREMSGVWKHQHHMWQKSTHDKTFGTAYENILNRHKFLNLREIVANCGKLLGRPERQFPAGLYFAMASPVGRSPRNFAKWCELGATL